MTWMIIRLILSLAFIGGVLLFAARLAKKRGMGQGSGLIEVVARHRLGRTSTLNVVRIADVVLVVSAEVVEALANSPVGKMDVAAALRPALEAAAATLGRVRVASERLEEPVAALDGLRDKGMFVAVPLMADGEHQATFALQVNLPAARGQGGSLDLLRHVAMEVTVEIGRTRMTVGELLSLHPGEVVELDRAASAPADLLVNGTLIARGEVVVVDEDFGLRISEIVSGAAAELGAVSA